MAFIDAHDLILARRNVSPIDASDQLIRRFSPARRARAALGNIRSACGRACPLRRWHWPTAERNILRKWSYRTQGRWPISAAATAPRPSARPAPSWPCSTSERDPTRPRPPRARSSRPARRSLPPPRAKGRCSYRSARLGLMSANAFAIPLSEALKARAGRSTQSRSCARNDCRPREVASHHPASVEVVGSLNLAETVQVDVPRFIAWK